MTYFQLPAVFTSYGSEKIKESANDISEEYFPDLYYEVLHNKAALMSPDDDSNSVPDYRFGVRGTKTVFWLESKFRIVNQLNEFIPVFEPGQLNRLKGFENSFLFLRVKIQREEYSFFVPVEHIKSDELHFSFLRPYLMTVAKPVRPNLVTKYISLSNQDFQTYFSSGIWS